MTRPIALRDELVRRALTPTSALDTPPGLLGAIMADVRASPRRSRLLDGWLGRGSGLVPASHGAGRWALVAAGVTLAIVLGLILAAGAPERPVIVSEQRFAGALFIRSLGVGPEEAWVASDGQLWHRDANGWSDPEPIGFGSARDLASLPDGRIVVAGTGGSGVREGAGRWTVLSRRHGTAVVTDAAGTIWIAESARDAAETFEVGFAAYRPVAGGWERTWVACPAGGWELAIDAAGQLWTAGFAYTGNAGLARWDGMTCDEVFPRTGGDRIEVIALATGPGGSVAIGVAEPAVGDAPYSGRTMIFDGEAWASIRTDLMAYPHQLAFGPGGELYAGFVDGIWRYRGGTWTMVIPGARSDHLSVTADGTLWYVIAAADDSSTVGHVQIADLPPD